MYDKSGINPENKSVWQNIRFYTITFVWIHIIYLVVILLVYKEEILVSNIIDSLESVELLVHGMGKAVGIFANRKKIDYLLDKMKTRFWTIDDIEDETEKQHQRKYLKFMKTIFLVYNGGCVLTVIAFLGKPLIHSGHHTVFESYRADWCPYFVLLAYEYIAYIYILYLPIVGTDLFIFSTFSLTCLQFRMLNSEMKLLFTVKDNQANKMSDKKIDREVIERKIQKCADHHQFLLDFVGTMNGAFSLLLFVYNGVIIISMCVDMYVISIEDSIEDVVKSLTYTINGIVEYSYCYCMPAQAITDQADKVGTSAYFSKWYEYPSHSVKIALLMIILNAQKPLDIIAYGVVKINMETCLKTIQTMISYCMFLRTMEL